MVLALPRLNKIASHMQVAQGSNVAAHLTRISPLNYMRAIDGRLSARNRKRSEMANSFLKNAFNRIVEARERQARRYVNGALLRLDDQSLTALGKSREELRREGASIYQL